MDAGRFIPCIDPTPLTELMSGVAHD